MGLARIKYSHWPSGPTAVPHGIHLAKTTALHLLQKHLRVHVVLLQSQVDGQLVQVLLQCRDPNQVNNYGPLFDKRQQLGFLLVLVSGIYLLYFYAVHLSLTLTGTSTA